MHLGRTWAREVLEKNKKCEAGARGMEENREHSLNTSRINFISTTNNEATIADPTRLEGSMDSLRVDTATSGKAETKHIKVGESVDRSGQDGMERTPGPRCVQRTRCRAGYTHTASN